MAYFASSLLVVNALDRIGDLFETNLAWVPGNSFQELVLSHSDRSRVIAGTLSPQQLFGRAAHEVATINAFLRSNGFGEIQLEDMGSGPDMAYVASIMKLLGRWLQAGEQGYNLPQNHKPAFRLAAHPGLAHFESRDGAHQMVRIQTDAGFDMWLVDSMFFKGGNAFAMIDPWIDFIGGAKMVTGNGAVLPYVKIDGAKVDISKLIGMHAGNTVIQQALAAAKFKLTSREVNFEMAVALGAKRLAMDVLRPERGDFVVGDYLNFALVRRQNPLMPLAVGQVQYSEFSNTADIV